jgi:hypothetical protein
MEGVRVSVSELAGIKGVSPQAISKRLARLQAERLIAVTARGREKTVNLAEWDSVTGEVTDPARLQAQQTTKAVRGLDDHVTGNAAGTKEPTDPTYTQELTRKAGYDADMQAIKVRKLRGELREVSEILRSAELAAEALVRAIDQLPTFADDLAAAVTKAGVPGLREALKLRAREMRKELAVTMAAIATGAATDEEEEDSIAA